MTIEGNRLADAVSPYLQQHRDNPVHWREWSDAALAEAAERDCPILLSVGYAACHWCHVMAHESFEDPAVAAVMNSLFVNIKVDREERPDLDHVYMTALQAMGEAGGWPMTMFLTPKGEPFWGGTYFPKTRSHGRPGFVELLEAIGRAWASQRSDIAGSAGAITARLAEALSARGEPGEAAPDLLPRVADRIAVMIDAKRGGMRGAPKFPNAPFMEILARSAFPAGPAAHAELFLTTVRALCEGGIYDHLGGGLHRYSTDDRWLVPHFEKMLYDNAQFLRHLLWAWRATGEALFRCRIDETIAWLEREMTVPGGGFAASLDADSADAAGHPEEGAFYVWTEGEVAEALGEGAARFAAVYDVGSQGNWEGKSILHRLHPGAHDTDAADDAELATARATLLARRGTRSRPARDDKVLADWNGLTIRALAEVAALTDDERPLRMARAAFAFVSGEMRPGGRLGHAARDGQCSGLALSSDYGAMIAAAVALFAATADASYLAEAKRLADDLETWHGDGEGGHFMTASDAADVILRPRGDQDDAVPSGTGLLLEALMMLAAASGDVEIGERAERAARLAAGRIGERAPGFPGIVAALDRARRGGELALLGLKEDPGFAAMLAAMQGSVDLNRLDVRLGDETRLPAGLPLAAVHPSSRPAAFLCQARLCRPPVYDAPALRAMLQERQT